MCIKTKASENKGFSSYRIGKRINKRADDDGDGVGGGGYVAFEVFLSFKGTKNTFYTFKP